MSKTFEKVSLHYRIVKMLVSKFHMKWLDADWVTTFIVAALIVILPLIGFMLIGFLLYVLLAL